MTDRLTEIRARVTSKIEVCARHGAEPPSWASDLEYALGEIGRLKGEVVIEREHYDLICEQVNGLVLQRDRMHAALQAIVDAPYGVALGDLERARAALEESK